MSNVNVTIKHGSLERIVKELSTKRQLEEIGKVAVHEMKKSLERGVPPIRGSRRLANYSASYTEAIKKGYYEKFSKKTRPVNLILSGQMLNALEYKTDNGLQVGIWDADMVERANYHQDGTANMPQRRFIPSDSGEKLTVTIERALLNKLEEIINRLNK